MKCSHQLTLVKYLQYTQYQAESDINAMVMVAVHEHRYNLFSATCEFALQD